jgi:hypothetical protein
MPRHGHNDNKFNHAASKSTRPRVHVLLELPSDCVFHIFCLATGMLPLARVYSLPEQGPSSQRTHESALTTYRPTVYTVAKIGKVRLTCTALRLCKFPVGLGTVVSVADPQQLQALERCTAVRSAAIYNLCAVANIHSWGASLLVLEVSVPYNLTDLQAVSTCVALQVLMVSCCEHLESVNGVSGCRALVLLRLLSCKKLSDISDLGRCKALRRLEVNGCPGVPGASSWMSLPNPTMHRRP